MRVIDDPPTFYRQMSGLELFHMDREAAIFMVLCCELEARGKIQFYKAAQAAERIEEALCARERIAIGLRT